MDTWAHGHMDTWTHRLDKWTWCEWKDLKRETGKEAENDASVKEGN